MHQIKSFAYLVISMLGLFCLSQQSLAARESRSEMNFLLPYSLGKTVEFDGGAVADIHDDVGFGFGYAYNYSDNLAYRVDLTWNSGTYVAKQKFTNGSESTIGDLDSFSVLFGADYYFTTGRVAPYANFNVGWIHIDSNLYNNPATTDYCWKTPWSAESCYGDKPTYGEKNMVGGLGLGMRFEVARRNFLRVGYYHEWVDFDQASDLEGLGSLRFEFGFLY